MMELFDLVSKWGQEKGITNPYNQLIKVMEEVGEIAHEMSRGNLQTPEMADAIGDSMVTLIVLANTLGLDPFACLEGAYEEIKDRKGKIVNGGFVKNDKDEVC